MRKIMNRSALTAWASWVAMPLSIKPCCSKLDLPAAMAGMVAG